MTILIGATVRLAIDHFNESFAPAMTPSKFQSIDVQYYHMFVKNLMKKVFTYYE